MTPCDFRTATYDTLRASLPELRQKVYAAWCRHSPATTRAASAAAGIDILTFRPRTTELLQLGLLRLSARQDAHGEGVYEATSATALAQWRQNQLDPQMHLL